MWITQELVGLYEIHEINHIQKYRVEIPTSNFVTEKKNHNDELNSTGLIFNLQ